MHVSSRFVHCSPQSLTLCLAHGEHLMNACWTNSVMIKTNSAFCSCCEDEICLSIYKCFANSVLKIIIVLVSTIKKLLFRYHCLAPHLISSLWPGVPLSWADPEHRRVILHWNSWFYSSTFFTTLWAPSRQESWFIHLSILMSEESGWHQVNAPRTVNERHINYICSIQLICI